MVVETSLKGKEGTVNGITQVYKRIFAYIKAYKVSLKPKAWLRLEAICCQLDAALADDIIMLAAKNEKTFDNCIKYYRPRRTTNGTFFPQQSKKVQKVVVYHLNKLATTSSHHVAIAEKVTEKEEQEIFLAKASKLAKSIEDHLEIVSGSIKTSLDYDKIIKIIEIEIKKAISLSRSPKDDERILTALSNVKIPKPCAFFLREDLKAIANKAIAERTPKSLPTTNLSESYKISQE